METIEAPQIKNLKEITPDEAAAYVKFVAEVRHTEPEGVGAVAGVGGDAGPVERRIT